METAAGRRGDAMAQAEARSGVFSGYASVFTQPDLAGDVVLVGAFSRTLARRPPAMVRMLWQHDPGQPLGRWLELREDGRGLFVRGALNLAVRRAAEIHALAMAGDIDGLSIGFRAVEATRDQRSGLRRLSQIDLWEISLVTFPMQPLARVQMAAQDAGAALAHAGDAGTERRMLASLSLMRAACGGAGLQPPPAGMRRR